MGEALKKTMPPPPAIGIFLGKTLTKYTFLEKTFFIDDSLDKKHHPLPQKPLFFFKFHLLFATPQKFPNVYATLFYATSEFFYATPVYATPQF